MTPEQIIREHMRALGSKGGKRAAENMTAEARRKRATKASRVASTVNAEKARIRRVSKKTAGDLTGR